jgi:hypothetical protein
VKIAMAGRARPVEITVAGRSAGNVLICRILLFRHPA